MRKIRVEFETVPSHRSIMRELTSHGYMTIDEVRQLENGSGLDADLFDEPHGGIWSCEYCGSAHPVAEFSCRSCGASRRERR